MRGRAVRMLQEIGACWEALRRLLAAEHIVLLEPDGWTPEARDYLHAHFSREICPVLTPLAFDPGHPFPLISNLSKNFAVVVRHGGRTKFARVKVPDVLPRFIPLPEPLGAPRSLTFVFLEHSRIYWFLNGGHEEMYIGSADLMERNLDRRVETLTPVRDAEILAHLRDVVLASYLRDADRATVLDAAGGYSRPDAASASFNAQDFLLKHYADAQNDSPVF